ncbi:hypothetical protein DEA98_08120 [Brucella pseudogrignonensis]|nr:hypothetical protein [Brucella pseudogrignonensis]
MMKAKMKMGRNFSCPVSLEFCFVFIAHKHAILNLHRSATGKRLYASADELPQAMLELQCQSSRVQRFQKVLK